jgi:hypothetical protein
MRAPPNELPMRFSLTLRFLAVGLGLLFTQPAFAQKKNKKTEPAAEQVNLDEESPKSDAKDEGDEKKNEEGADEASNEEGEKSDEEKKEGDRPVEPEEERKSTSPVEHPGETYRFVGLRYRLLWIPGAVMGLFGEGGETVFVHNFGPEFTVRRDGFEYSFAATYSPYHMGDGPTSANQVAFKAPEDPETAWEVVTSEIKIIYLTADFNWSHPFNDEVSLTYGGGAGIGFVFGNLYRTQAYKENGKYLPCPGPPTPTSPPNQIEYCAPEPDDDPQHYPGYTEPSWANGGSKPIIFPWIALQTGIRWKPHRNFVTRAEIGVGLGQFWVGVGADYGL